MPDLTFDEALAIGVGVGGLHDALRFTGGDDVDAARTEFQTVRAQWGRLEETEDAAEITAVLGLPKLDDPFGRLFAEEAALPDGFARNPDGWLWERFGRR